MFNVLQFKMPYIFIENLLKFLTEFAELKTMTINIYWQTHRSAFNHSIDHYRLSNSKIRRDVISSLFFCEIRLCRNNVRLHEIVCICEFQNITDPL